MVRLGQPVVEPVSFADPVEARLPGTSYVLVATLLGELDAVVGQVGLDLGKHGLKHIQQEFLGGPSDGSVNDLRDREFGGKVSADEHVQLAIGYPYLSNIDLKEADRLPLVVLVPGLVAFDVRQARDAVSVSAPMKR